MRHSGLAVLWMGLFACATATSGTTSTASHAIIVSPSPTTNPVSPSPTTNPVSPPVTTSTSTMVSPSTTVRPTPLPDETYLVKKNNTICIRMKAEIKVQVTYPVLNATMTSNTVTLRVTNSTDPHVDPYRSFCGKDDSNMTIVWGTDMHSFVLEFERRQYFWNLRRMKLYLNADSSDFPDIYVAGNDTMVEATTSGTVFSNEFQRSYKCDPLSTFKLTTVKNTSFNKTDFMATLKLSGWQVQAFEFRHNDGTKFGNARLCPQSQSNGAIVPIAVGIALGVLITAVVVVYLLSRLRKRRLTSYESLN